MADVVVDASALVDLLLANRLGDAVARRLTDERLHAPGHLDVEVLSAPGRLHRAGHLTEVQVETMLRALRAAPITRHDLADLVLGAWQRRDRVRLVDAVYLELAERVDGPLITTDLRLRDEARVEAVRSDRPEP